MAVMFLVCTGFRASAQNSIPLPQASPAPVQASPLPPGGGPNTPGDVPKIPQESTKPSQETPAFTKEPPKVLSLEECIRTGITNRPDLQALGQSILAAKAVVGAGMGAYYPQVTFSSTYVRNGSPDKFSAVTTSTGIATSVISGVSTTYTDSLVVRQLITDFGRLGNQVLASQQSYVASLYGYVTLRNQILSDVKKAYYNCIAAQELFKVKQENVAVYEAHLKQSQGMYNAGRSSKIDVTKSEVDLATARNDLITADNAYKVARVTVINVMGLDTPFNFELVRDLTLPEIDLSYEEAQQIAGENRPELLQSEAQINAQKANLSAAVAAFYPTITGNAQYNWQGNDYPLDRYWQLGLQLNLTVFDGNSRLYVVKQNRAILENLMDTKKRLWQNIKLQLEQSYLVIKASREKITLTAKTVQQAEENFRLALGRYNVGAGSNLEYSDAQQALLQARTDQIAAHVAYFNSIADFEQAMGIELKTLEERKKKADQEKKPAEETVPAPQKKTE